MDCEKKYNIGLMLSNIVQVIASVSWSSQVNEANELRNALFS